MAYSPTVYVNDSAPALSAENLNKSEKELQVLDDGLNNSVFEQIGYIKNFVFAGEGGITSSFYIEAGKSYTVINITEDVSTMVPGGTMFVEGYSSDSQQIPTFGTQKTVSFSHSGLLRVYSGVSGTTKYYDMKIQGEYDLNGMKNDLTNVQGNISTINNKLSTIDDAIYIKKPLTGHFIFSGAASALSEIELTAGNTYTITNKTAGVSGGLIYIDGHTSTSKSFPANGSSVEFTPADTGFLKYYDSTVASGTDVVFTAFGVDVYDTEAALPIIQNEIATINNILDNMDAPLVYTVGSGKQYESFVDCINALPDSGSKVVYVYPGTYDIYDEMGGDAFVSSLSGSELWYNVNPIIPLNTKIIGIGRVVFTYNCPDNIDSSKAVLLSCLNMRGSASVENINIVCKNLRYAIHIEGSAFSEFNNSKYEVKRCTMHRQDGTYENAAIGIGLNYGCEVIIEGCQIKTETTHGNSLLIHGNVEALAGSEKLTIKDSVMIDNYMTLQLMCRPNSNAIIPVYVANTYLKTLIYKTTGSGQQCDDEFDVTLLNCNNVSVSNGQSIVNLRTVNRYNTIGS